MRTKISSMHHVSAIWHFAELLLPGQNKENKKNKSFWWETRSQKVPKIDVLMKNRISSVYQFSAKWCFAKLLLSFQMETFWKFPFWGDTGSHQNWHFEEKGGRVNKSSMDILPCFFYIVKLTKSWKLTAVTHQFSAKLCFTKLLLSVFLLSNNKSPEICSVTRNQILSLPQFSANWLFVCYYYCIKMTIFRKLIFWWETGSCQCLTFLQFEIMLTYYSVLKMTKLWKLTF